MKKIPYAKTKECHAVVDSVVVFEESPCLEDPRGPIFKSLSLSSEVYVLENFRGLSRLGLSASALCAGVSAGVAVT